MVNPLRLRPPEDTTIVVELAGVSSPDERAALLTYWSVQQDRMSSHEGSRYNFSNFIVAGSLTVLSIAGTGVMNSTGKWITCLAVIVVNLLSCSFILSELRWFKIHQARARAVMRHLHPDVGEMQTLAEKRWKTVRADARKGPTFTSSAALLVIHWILSLCGLAMGMFGRVG